MKTAIITGGSSGIGASIVKNLSAKNYNCVSWDINSPIDSTNEHVTGNDKNESSKEYYVFCDVTSEESINKAYDETVEKYGTPSILINNCGLQYMASVEEFPLNKWNQLINVMLTGTFLCSKKCIPYMKEKKFGRIINISSVHGKLASPYKSAYVAAKHGVHGLSKVMALELADYGITVNNICPGFVETPLMRNQISSQAKLNDLSEDEVISKIMLKDSPIKSFTSPKQVSQMLSFLLSEDASTITGESYSMSGGWGMGL